MLRNQQQPAAPALVWSLSAEMRQANAEKLARLRQDIKTQTEAMQTTQLQLEALSGNVENVKDSAHPAASATIQNLHMDLRNQKNALKKLIATYEQLFEIGLPKTKPTVTSLDEERRRKRQVTAAPAARVAHPRRLSFSE